MSRPLLDEPVAEPVLLDPQPMGRLSRWALVGLAGLLACMLGIACCLTPDERGFGTHEQLGLPPCAFRALIGIPCPSCGMTTSFAFVVRGQLVSAASTNPGGCVLALGTIGLIPWCVASAVAGRTIGVRSPERLAVAIVPIVLAISLVGWAVRIVL